MRQLLLIRSVFILIQAAVLWYLSTQGLAEQSRSGMLYTLGAMAVLTALALARSFAKWPVGQLEFGGHLAVDLLGLSALLYFSGGINNPFLLYFLVPITFASARLPRRYAWLAVALSIAACLALAVFHEATELFAEGAVTGNSIYLHSLWVYALLSALAIAAGLANFVEGLKRDQAAITEARVEQLRNDQVMTIYNLAGGTARELDAPLATIKVTVDELADTNTSPANAESLDLLADQAEKARAVVDKLSHAAQLTQPGGQRKVVFADYMRTVVENWLGQRKGATATVHIEGEGASPLLPVDLSLGQAIDNLLNNAADAWREDIEVTVDWDDQHISVAIADKGPGISQQMLDKVGKTIIKGGGAGLGLGLLLSQVIANRYGGDIELCNRRQGGTCATLRLPRQD